MTGFGNSEAGQVDLFGLWDAAPQAGAQSFSLDDAGAQHVGEDLVWSVDLRSGPGGAIETSELDQRAQAVQAIGSGLGRAVIGADRTLARHAAAKQGAAVSFSVDDPPAELDLAAALVEIDPGDAPTSFALGLPSVDWDELKRNYDAFMDSINRQVLHYAWVETKLDGSTALRTAVQWGGDLDNTLSPGLRPDIAAAHNRSLTLALAARAANMQTAITVMSIAAKIALAVTTPIGAIQALGLAWQFVRGVILPQLEGAKT